MSCSRPAGTHCSERSSGRRGFPHEKIRRTLGERFSNIVTIDTDGSVANGDNRRSDLACFTSTRTRRTATTVSPGPALFGQPLPLIPGDQACYRRCGDVLSRFFVQFMCSAGQARARSARPSPSSNGPPGSPETTASVRCSNVPRGCDALEDGAGRAGRPRVSSPAAPCGRLAPLGESTW